MKNIKKKSILLLLPLAFLTLNGCDEQKEVISSTTESSIGNVDSSVTESEFAVTIEETENGTVTANKTKAKVGEEVEFTITVDEGYYVKSFLVNEKEVALTKNKASVEMVEGGLRAKLIVTDSYPVSVVDEAFEKKVEGLDNFKYAFNGDASVEKLPLAKLETTIDLGGHTVTFTGEEFIHSIQNDQKENVQKVTLKNGSVKIDSTEEVNNFINATYAKKFTVDGIKVEAKTSVYTGIYCSSSTDLSILNSTFDLKAVFVVGTNNLEGNNAGILVENSTLMTTTDDKDNAAMLVNTVGSTVTIKNSKLTADRQAVIARTGTWEIEGSTLTTTGAWLDKSEGNANTNNSYLSGAWKAGNEVPSSALVIGDNVDNAYNENVVLTAKNTSFAAQKGLKVVTRRDTKHTTTVTMDSLTYKNAKDALDNGKGVSLSLSDNGETLTDLTATVETGEGGEATLSKETAITYGEKIDVTATPNDGYKVDKVTLTGIDGTETDITAAMSFNAGLKNVVKVTFAVKETGGTTITAKDLFPDVTVGNKMSIDGDFKANGFTFSFPTKYKLSYMTETGAGALENPILRVKGEGTVVKISKEDNALIKKVEMTFRQSKGTNGGPDNLELGDASDATYTSNENTGVWESAAGQETVNLKVEANTSDSGSSYCMVDIISFKIFCA